MTPDTSVSLDIGSSISQFADSSILLDHAKVMLPSTTDPLVAALQRLLMREGGYAAVAAKAKVNDQSLYQIATLRRDVKSGKTKSVGPSIRKRLDNAYPGWLDAADEHSSTRPTAPPALSDALPVVLRALGSLTMGGWDMVRTRLDKMAGHPEMLDDVLNDVLMVFEAQRRKHGTGE